MKKKSLFLLLGMLCMSTITVTAQSSMSQKIVDIAKADNQVMNHLATLSSRFGGRILGSDAYENAAAWMQYQYTKWGLETHLEEAGELPLGFNRDAWFGKLYGPDGTKELHFVTPSYTSGTVGRQRGHVLIEPKSEQEFNAMKSKLKGAWVLISGTSNGFPINATAKADSIREVIKAENAIIAKENRAAMMRRYETGEKVEMKKLKEQPALYLKEMVEAGVLGFIQSAPLPLKSHYDRYRIDEGSLTFETIPSYCEIKLDEHQYNEIYQLAKDRRDFQLEFDIRNHFKVGPVKYHNVIATIKGTKYPNEYVIISGHLDSFDSSTGSVDCGTGIGPMMEAARLLAKAGAKPKRTIVFVGFAGEEFGLWGAQAYVKAHKNEISKISALFNRDGGPLADCGIAVPANIQKELEKICEPIKGYNAQIPFEVTTLKPRKKPKQFGGTDASVFGMEGVPCFQFNETDVLGYDFKYTDIWHTENDIYNQLIPEYMEQASVAIAVTALGIANLDKIVKPSDFYAD